MYQKVTTLSILNAADAVVAWVWVEALLLLLVIPAVPMILMTP
jgi:hypothetical protein